jgi:arylsulfatase A-like enzyme
MVAGAVLVFALAAGAAGCGEARRQAIVLVVIDTLRADHMSVYGYDRPTSPVLEQQAGDAVVFDRAFATAPWTLPSIASIVTGLLPSTHGGGRVYFEDDGDQQVTGMNPEIRTIMQELQAAGYVTHGIGNAIYVNGGFGFDRGLDVYDWQGASDSQVRTADVTVDLALEFIDAHRDDDFFLLVHMFDPHRHYDAPEPFRGMFTEVFAGTYGETLATRESRDRAEDNLDWPFIVAAYDEEVAFVDHQVGRLLDGLRSHGLLQDGLVVLTSDHGETMDEHADPGHGATLYDEVLRVPMMVWGGGLVPGRRLDPVSTVDIASTILTAAAIDLEQLEQPLDGISLWPALSGGADLPERMLFAERSFGSQRQLKSVIRWPLKLVVNSSDDAPRLFNLENDPAERHDLWGTRSDDYYEFVAAIQRLEAIEQGQPADYRQLDPQTLKALRALGYVR